MFCKIVEKTYLVNKRKWKNLDLDAIDAGSQALRQLSAGPKTAQEIEDYVEYLMGFINDLVATTVPWARPSSRANPWWTSGIQELVQREQKLRRH